MTKQRNTATKKKIKEVLTDLVAQKGLTAVTVSDITRAANINRGTFYLHYLDKVDLLEKLEQELIDDLSNILLSGNSVAISVSSQEMIDLFPYETILEAIQYVKDDFDFISTITNRGRNQYFIDLFKEILGRLIDQKCQQYHIKSIELPGIPDDYTHELILSQVNAIITRWLSTGGQEEPEEVARMITQIKTILPIHIHLED